jgi:hypothetical protein
MECLGSSMRKSPRQVECCAVLGPWPQGEPAFSPLHLIIWPPGKSKRVDYRVRVALPVAPGHFDRQTPPRKKMFDCEDHKLVRIPTFGKSAFRNVKANLLETIASDCDVGLVSTFGACRPPASKTVGRPSSARCSMSLDLEGRAFGRTYEPHFSGMSRYFSLPSGRARRGEID